MTAAVTVTRVPRTAQQDDLTPVSVPLQKAETEAIRAAFGESGADLAQIRRHVDDVVLPKIKAALGWTAIRAVKGRVNDWRTVDLKYNSLFHRDRHVYGAAPPADLGRAAKQNLSAVVYLDKARLDYIEGSAVSSSDEHSHRELMIAEGMVLVFPSCLIHRAVASAESQRRRTIVLFDIEDPSASAPLRHDIVVCPWWTQKPLLHSVSSEEEVEQRMLRDLLANRPYFWRYYRRGELRRTHWQVTTANDHDPTAGVRGSEVPYNTSFYLIAPQEFPSQITVYDHRGTLRYMWNLLWFHLGFEVLK